MSAQFPARLRVFCLALFIITLIGFTSAPIGAMVPSNFVDIEVKFGVHPDGNVELSGRVNYTSGYPLMGTITPAIHVSGKIGKNNGTYDLSINSTIEVPPQEAEKFPLNATTMSILSEYSDDIFNSAVNASIILPHSSSMDTVPLDLSGFPFNSTDFTFNGKYSEQTFNGTLTVHMVPGLPLGDVEMHFEGNLTEITISDSVTVFYDLPSLFPGLPALNETFLNTMIQMLNSTIPGEGPGSLYAMTEGMLKCTTLEATLTPIDDGGVISFFAVIQGDFIQAVAKILTTQIPPDTFPPLGQPYALPNATSMYASILNATIYSLKTGTLNMSYSSSIRRFDLQASSTENVTESWNATTQQMLATYPPEMQQYIGQALNATHNLVRSYAIAASYSEALMNLKAEYVLEGDLNEQLTLVKNLFLDMLDATYPSPTAESLMDTLKAITSDVSNLKIDFDFYNDSVQLNFEGLKVAPPVDWVNGTCFKLRRFFNMTSTPSGESPRQNERMKLTVEGLSNGTHTLAVSIDPADPDRVANPDETVGGNTMIWNNQSISKLKSLIFRVFEGHAETVYDPNSVTTENPFTIDARQSANCMLVLDEVSNTAVINIKNITEPTDVTPPPETYKALGSFLQITADPGNVVLNATIRIYYTPEQLSTSGIDENTLKIMYWDDVANDWVPIDTQINTSEHYVWAKVSHLSTWTVMGQLLPPFWQQLWFIALLAVIVAAVLIVVVTVFLRKKHPSQETPPPPPAGQTATS